jgi:F-type H+-transporting ATPase subunit b
VSTFALLAAEAVEKNDPKDLYPHWNELIVGAVAFFVLMGFMAKWVLPRVNRLLEERRAKIVGQLEEAERTRREAEEMHSEYRTQLGSAREEANRIIEEARKTAEQLRRDIQNNAEREAEATVARTQDAIRAERERAFDELRAQVASLAVDLAGIVVSRELDATTHQRLIDDYIDKVAATGNGRRGSSE